MKNLNLNWIVVVLTMFSIVSSTFSWDLKGEYSELGVYKVYNIKRAFTLKCEADEIVDVVWFKDGQAVTEIDELEDRFEIDVEKDEEENTVISKLTVTKSNNDDSGRYSCRVHGEGKDEEDQIQEFMVVGQIVIKAPSNIEVVEGETARINCVVVGYRPTVEWLLPETANLSRISYENDTEIEGDQGNILVIEDTDRTTDRAVYTCEAYSADEYIFQTINEGKKLTSKSFLRVKDKYGFMYPLTGLIIVIVLFLLIVVVSEHHRRKLEAENADEADTFEDNPPVKKADSIRQRK